MPAQLKDFFDDSVVRALAASLAEVHPGFDKKGFIRDATKGLEDLELTGRARHLAAAMRAHLPASYPDAIALLTRSLDAAKTSYGQDHAMTGFLLLPHVYFVETYGLDDFEASMAFQYEVTQRFTAEFSIRAYLQRHPERTLKRLKKWAKDPSEHVRRLVSEGSRPRLPWASRLPAFQKDPAPVLELLELLKDDDALYVRRSVANNLNDIGKDHPELLVETCRRWMKGASPDRVRIVRHALRSLVKACHPGALAVLGYADAPSVDVRKVQLEPSTLKIGEKLKLNFEVVAQGNKPQTLLIDCAVHFVKSNGEAKPKVFKLTEVKLSPGESAPVRATISFAQHTTRTHFPGEHVLDVLINGTKRKLGAVRVVAADDTKKASKPKAGRALPSRSAR